MNQTLQNNIMRASWATIDTRALQHNIHAIQERIGPEREIMAVLKADAYGHGAIETAPMLRDWGVQRFAVATIDEAIKLRESGIESPITLLSPCPNSSGSFLAEYNLQPLVSSYENARALAAAAEAADKDLELFIAVDTGMTRIGYVPSEPDSVAEIAKIAALPHVKILGLFSHFAASDETDMSYTKYQHLIFLNFASTLRDAGIKLPALCIANSGAIISYSPSWHDIVRPGIIMYGYYPSNEVDHTVLDLQPAMQISSRIARLRWIDRGTSVSYNRKYIAPGRRLIATIPIGYADGYPRLLSSRSRVIVNNCFAPQVGNICMDQCMIDVTEVPDVQIGDKVVLMGRQGDLQITANELAELADTINYEIICGFSQRLPRVYTEE